MKWVVDKRGIKIPFPHQTMYFGVGKIGWAPATCLALRNEPDTGAAAPAASTDSRAGTPAEGEAAAGQPLRPAQEV